ncbi:hypothetical protein GF360_02125 [candidate division WWE3 bacterium]|nr:hypothetical protein [candidate division WWE3 bacterium]
MNDEKIHTIYTSLPEKVNQYLFQLYKKLSKKFPNEYLDENNFKAHIAVGGKLLPGSKTKEFVKEISKLAQNTDPFEVTLTKYTKSSNNKYIFLEMDEKAQKTFKDLNEKFLEKANKIHKVKIPRKYLDNWKQYPKEEQHRIKTNGNPYEYHAHISIVKIDPKNIREALEIAKEHNEILKNTFMVKEFVISGQSNDPQNQFPILARVSL